MDERLDLRRLLAGYQVTQALHVAAVLGVADLLGDGPRPVAELATETGSDADALYRLLRTLAALGVLHEGEERRFALAPAGEALRSDVPDSIAGWAAFVGRPSYWQAWGALLHSVRTGENAFRQVHGTDVWRYRAERPEESVAFDRAMASLTRRAETSLLEAYDFGRFGTVVDVGGGNGTLLAAVLLRHPSLQGVLFDQPHVAEGARATLATAGVADRCRVVGGSFFDAVPEGGDAYVLKMIVHDWEDAEAVAILSSCRAALAGDGVVLVVERVLGGPNETLDVKLSDLNMLVAPGGRERTAAEYAALFDAAGLALAADTPTASGLHVLGARPA
mgnify:CR=1 FL=1